jgi:hypothetical protein
MKGTGLFYEQTMLQVAKLSIHKSFGHVSWVNMNEKYVLYFYSAS